MQQDESLTGEARETMLQWTKLQIADHARLMMDNQKTVNRTNKSDERFRDFQHRQREHLAEKVGHLRKASGDDVSEEDPMEIKIDSPTTINETHNHMPSESKPEQTNPKTDLAKSAVAAGVAALLLGTGITAPLVAWNLTRPAIEQAKEIVEKPTPVFDDTDTQYGLRIYRSKNPTP